VIEEFLDVKNVLGFCVFCGCFPVVAKEDMCWRFFDNYVEIGLIVVVASLGPLQQQIMKV